MLEKLALFSRIRSKLNDIVQSPIGDRLASSRLSKAVARRANELLGDRLGGQAKPASPPVAAATVAKREPAPVVVYFERDRNQRLLDRVQELLSAKAIPYRALDVGGDAATLAFIMREAKCEDDDLPIIFVSGAPIGGYNELVDWDVSGKLQAAVFGA